MLSYEPDVQSGTDSTPISCNASMHSEVSDRRDRSANQHAGGHPNVCDSPLLDLGCHEEEIGSIGFCACGHPNHLPTPRVPEALVSVNSFVLQPNGLPCFELTFLISGVVWSTMSISNVACVEDLVDSFPEVRAAIADMEQMPSAKPTAVWYAKTPLDTSLVALLEISSWVDAQQVQQFDEAQEEHEETFFRENSLLLSECSNFNRAESMAWPLHKRNVWIESTGKTVNPWAYLKNAFEVAPQSFRDDIRKTTDLFYFTCFPDSASPCVP